MTTPDDSTPIARGVTLPDSMLPKRPPWEASGVAVTFSKFPSRDPENVPDLYAMVVDTALNRNVSFWTKENLEPVLRRGLDVLGVIPDGLVLASPTDLQNLRPPEPPR